MALRMHSLAWRMRYRVRDDVRQPATPSRVFLRVPASVGTWCQRYEARSDCGVQEDARVRDLAVDARSLPPTQQPCVGQLRRPRHHSLRPLASRLRGISCRHGAKAEPAPLHRPHRQRRQLRARQLSMGDRHGAGAKHAHELNRRVQRQVSVHVGVVRSSRHSIQRTAEAVCPRLANGQGIRHATTRVQYAALRDRGADDVAGGR